jgi:anti-sigma factor RsiW
MTMIRWITCREFVEFLDDYLEGRLAGRALEEFNNHLAGCPPCVTYMQTYRDTVVLTGATLGPAAEPVPVSVPEDLVAAILAARRKADDR